MAKAPKKTAAKKAKTTAKKAASKATVKKTVAKKATTHAKKAVAKTAAPKKAKRKKSAAKASKKVTGYGGGGVDVVMSVDQVAKEAASIAANAPTHNELLKLAGNDPLLTIEDLRAGYGKMEILHEFHIWKSKKGSLYV